MATPAQVKLYVEKFRPIAIEATQGSTISPDTVLTVSGVESQWGLSGLARKDNNFFGIKADKAWKGKKSNWPTKEVVNGKTITINAYFRSYDSPAESFKDYVSFLTKNKRYQQVLKETTPQGQFAALKAAGYATDPDYATKMVNTLKGLSKHFTDAASKVAKKVGLKKEHIPIMAIAALGMAYFVSQHFKEK